MTDEEENKGMWTIKDWLQNMGTIHNIPKWGINEKKDTKTKPILYRKTYTKRRKSKLGGGGITSERKEND